MNECLVISSDLVIATRNTLIINFLRLTSLRSPTKKKTDVIFIGILTQKWSTPAIDAELSSRYNAVSASHVDLGNTSISITSLVLLSVSGSFSRLWSKKHCLIPPCKLKTKQELTGVYP
jgi:hypothetical protein